MSYYGYRNWETWHAYCWIADGDEFFIDAALECETIEEAAEMLRAIMEEDGRGLTGFAASVFTSNIIEVDWEAIAKNLRSSQLPQGELQQ